MRPRLRFRLVGFLGAIGIIACRPERGQLPGTEPGAAAPAARAAEPAGAPQAPQDTVSAAPGPFARPLAAAREGLPVVGMAGPGGAPFLVSSRSAGDPAYLYRRMGGEAVGLALRSTTLRQYPCSSCHTSGVPPGNPEGAFRVHQDIPRSHPTAGESGCTNCHRSGAVDALSLFGGETASLDQAYRLCAQCHSGQAADWAGGAHGKRLEAWAGPRVVLNCTDCHDPHLPVTPRRNPYPGPRLPGARRGH